MWVTAQNINTGYTADALDAVSILKLSIHSAVFVCICQLHNLDTLKNLFALMNDSLRKRYFNFRLIKGDFYPFSKFSCHRPLF